jgi:hypothetical protein
VKTDRGTKKSSGGHARAASLPVSTRSEIARKAALARWAVEKNLPKETHEGSLQIGDHEIPCSVLDHEKRVFSTRGIARVMGSKKTGTENTGTGAPQLPPFLAAKNLSPYISKDLAARLNNPIIYQMKRGGRAHGYPAELLPDICDAILDADANRALRETQMYLVHTAGTIRKALGKVGIIALVDEVTGFQEDRAKKELQRLLQTYVVDEMRPWLKLFPDEFFRQVYRLHGWEFKAGTAQRTPHVGRLINEYIYKRLPDPVLPELRRRNPSFSGRRRHKHHQFLTDHTGIPHLDKQIAVVTTLMRVARDKRDFLRMIINAYPREGDQQMLDIDRSEGEA